MRADLTAFAGVTQLVAGAGAGGAVVALVVLVWLRRHPRYGERRARRRLLVEARLTVERQGGDVDDVERPDDPPAPAS